MLQRLAISLMFAVFLPTVSYALGLGEIKLNSALSQPLEAKIELYQVRDLAPEEIKASIASADDFAAAGVERTYLLSSLKFEVEFDGSGNAVINVSSRSPIREPFLNFLVEVHWPAGRLLREYTLLLDPPLFTSSPSAPVQKAMTSAPVAAPKPAPRPAAARPAPRPAAPVQRPSQPAASSTVAPGSFGPTGSSDSLWDIARELRPVRDVTIQQTMVAIQRKNPNAFIDNNINLIKKGQTIQAPTAEDVRSITTREAIAEVARQNQAWRDRVAGRRADARVVTTEIKTRDSQVQAVDSSKKTVAVDRVRLAAPTDEVTAQGGAGGSSASNSAALSAARNELVAAEENQLKAERQAEELQGRVVDLESQVETSEKLLSLKNDQIANLQAKLAELEARMAAQEEALKKGVTAPSVADPFAAPTVAESVEAPEGEGLEGTETGVVDPLKDPMVGLPEGEETEGAVTPEEAGIAEAAEQTIEAGTPAAPVEVSEVPEEAPKEVSVAQPAEPQRTVPWLERVYQQIMSDPLYIGAAGAGLIVLLLLLMMALKSGKRQDSAPLEPEMGDFDGPLNLDFDGDAPTALVDTGEEDAAPQVDKKDLLSEAEVYIAYGKFAQAVDILVPAINEDPECIDYRLKLLEVYAESNDLEAFDAQHSALMGLNDSGAIAKADELRSRFDGVAAGSGELDLGEDADLEGAFDGLSDTDTEDDAIPSLEDLEKDLASAPLDEGEEVLDQDGDLQDVDGLQEELTDESLDLDAPDILEEAADQNPELDSALDSMAAEEEGSAVETQESEDNEFDLDFELPSLDDVEPATGSVDNGIETVEQVTEEEGADEEQGLEFDVSDLMDDAEASDEAATESERESERESESSDLDSSVMDFDSESLDLDGADLSELEAEISADLNEEPVAESEDAGLEFSLDEGLDDSAVDADLADSGEAEASTEDNELEFDVSDDLDSEFESSDLDLAAIDSIESENEADAASAPEGVLELDVATDDESADVELDAMDFDSSADETLEVDAEATSDGEDGSDVVPHLSVVPDTGTVAGDDAESVLAEESEEKDLVALMSDNFDVVAEANTKLNLARAYIDMGDHEGARDILDEVLVEGDSDAKSDAKALLDRIG